MTLTAAQAGTWLQRWDAQQEYYIADREERFAVIGDVLAAALGEREPTASDAGPVVLDLGCGPGSLSARLAGRLPGARLIGLDNDPLLLALGAARYPGIEFVDADLTGPNWPRRVPGTVDAAVSTTALHWLPTEALHALYVRLGELIRPGGVFVNGDHQGLGTPALDRLAVAVRNGRAARAGVSGNEQWAAWWDAVLAVPAFAELATARERRQRTSVGTQHADAHDEHSHGSNGLSVAEHADALRAAGFTEVATVWQCGDDQVLVAVR